MPSLKKLLFLATCLWLISIFLSVFIIRRALELAYTLATYLPRLALVHLGLVSPRPRVVRTPESRFASLPALGYPFEPHYVEVEGVRMHYVDEGPRDAHEVVLMLHGEPSWSFLYRGMITRFVAAGHRAVAPDFIGFGRSDKLTDMDEYTHEMHCASLRSLVEQLDLRNVTLVVQDWGGLTGLSTLKSIHERVLRVVIMNTGLPPHPTDTLGGKIVFATWRSFVMAAGCYLPIGRSIQGGTTTNLTPEVVAAYDAPFPSAQYKAGAAKWPLLVPMHKGMHVAKDMLATHEFLRHWEKPALVAFSDKDPITRGLHKFFEQLLPAAHQHHAVITNGGHFLQEDCPEQLAQEINAFISATS